MKPFRVFTTFAVTILLLFNVYSQESNPILDVSEKDIVILFDNDVHCHIEGYSRIAELRDEILGTTKRVAVVSCGDFISGESLGIISRGSYPIEVMNAVGYDIITLGNHEFDYGIPRMDSLLQQLTAEVTCCNFRKLPDMHPYKGYVIKDFDGIKVAFIGAVTPETYTDAGISKFMVGDTLAYDFHEKDIDRRVQHQVDAARNAGAQYVVILSHLGVGNSDTLVAHTSGIDVVLDAHSHKTFAQKKVGNKDGKDVLISSTGSKFENIGALIIDAEGHLETALVPCETINTVNTTVETVIQSVNKRSESILSPVVGKSDVNLIVKDNGKWLVRKQECNMGNFVADAWRYITGADIGLMNSGGCRENINAGEIKVKDIYDLLSFTNDIVTASITGEELLETLEFSAYSRIEENGAFLQVSGLTFEIDLNILEEAKRNGVRKYNPSTCKHCVSNVRVYNPQSNAYEAISPDKRYTIATTDFTLCNRGNGYIFHTATSLRQFGPQQQVLKQYIQSLKGTIGSEYKESQKRITLIE